MAPREPNSRPSSDTAAMARPITTTCFRLPTVTPLSTREAIIRGMTISHTTSTIMHRGVSREGSLNSPM